MEYNYPLDYHWSTEEIIDVIALYNAVVYVSAAPSLHP